MSSVPAIEDVAIIRLFIEAEIPKATPGEDPRALTVLLDYFWEIAHACLDPTIIPDLTADHSHISASTGLDSYSWMVDIELDVAMWKRCAAVMGYELVEGSVVPEGEHGFAVIETTDDVIPVLLLDNLLDERIATTIGLAIATEITPWYERGYERGMLAVEMGATIGDSPAPLSGEWAGESIPEVFGSWEAATEEAMDDYERGYYNAIARGSRDG